MPKVAVIQVSATRSKVFSPSTHTMVCDIFTEMPKSDLSDRKRIEVESIKYSDYDAVLQFDKYNSEEEMLEALEAAFKSKIVGHWIATAGGMNSAETKEFRCWKKFFTYYDQLIPTVGE